MTFERGQQLVIITETVMDSELAKGDIVEIVKLHEGTGNDYEVKVVKSKTCRNGDIQSVYDYEMGYLDKENRVKYLTKEIKTKRKYIDNLKQELEFMETYENKEDFIAHKIIEELGLDTRTVNQSKLKKLLKKYKDVEYF